MKNLKLVVVIVFILLLIGGYWYYSKKKPSPTVAENLALKQELLKKIVDPTLPQISKKEKEALLAKINRK